MAKIIRLTFNPLYENTYIVYDDTKECVIIDPGCQLQKEKDTLKRYISDLELKPQAVLNTHCHFDHVFGNNFICNEYGIEPWAHEGDLLNIKRFAAGASLFGISADPPKAPASFLKDGMIFRFGQSELKVIHTPGHSPGSVCFYSENDKWLISGDTLFAGSIGRTDLPGGDFDTIKQSLKQLTQLPDETVVYPGHDTDTTIGKEKLYNPFLNEKL
jgi:glyoxylase-like metal-dependent hydrolase (beta-lactamase superfamily II)